MNNVMIEVKMIDKIKDQKKGNAPSKKHSENKGHRSDNLRANLLRRKQKQKDQKSDS